MYQIKSGGEELIIWGDLMHIQAIQFPVPAQTVSYDSDVNAARIVREQTLAYAAKTGALMAGHHLLFPAIGRVSTDANGSGYRFEPLTLA
jgi:hypothetical protein